MAATMLFSRHQSSASASMGTPLAFSTFSSNRASLAESAPWSLTNITIARLIFLDFVYGHLPKTLRLKNGRQPKVRKAMQSIRIASVASLHGSLMITLKMVCLQYIIL